MPSLFGIMTRFTGSGLYVLFLSASSSSARKAVTPSCSSMASKVTPSMPALPLLARTR